MKTLERLVIIHLYLLFFQYAIRWYADISLVRDICIFAILIVYYTKVRRHTFRDNSLSKYLKGMSCFGVIAVITHLTYSNVLGIIIEYRNFFFPFLLVSPLTCLFSNESFIYKLYKYIWFLFAILIVDIYLEWLMDLFNISRDILPWYRYQYLHCNRFTTAEDPIPNAIGTEFSPVLGFIGWPNATSCTLVALYSLFAPFLLSQGTQGTLFFEKYSNKQKYFVILASIGAMAILGIKTPIAAFCVVNLILISRSNKSIIKQILIVAFIATLLAYFTRNLWMESFDVLYNETQGEDGAFMYIFSLQTIFAILSSLINSSPFTILFGGDFTSLPFYEMIEIRLLTFTLQYGIIWFVLFCAVMYKSIVQTRLLAYRYDQNSTKYKVITGILLMLIVYYIDMLHYANMMYLFNLSLFIVMISVISSLISNNKIYG